MRSIHTLILSVALCSLVPSVPASAKQAQAEDPAAANAATIMAYKRGKPAWLRLTTVDYVGDLPTPPCDKVAVQMALNEEEGVERSLGLGCGKPKAK